MDEIWRQITGYEGRYDVSTTGRLRSWVPWVRGNRKTPWLVNGYPNTSGHLRVMLFDGSGGHRSLYIHRLVLLTFMGDPPPGKPQCAHLDGNPKNNRLNNLIWASAVENASHKLLHGTHSKMGEQCNLSRFKESDVLLIRKLYADGEAVQILAKKYGVFYMTIKKIVTRRSWWHI